MSYDREKVKADLKAVIIAECRRLRIDYTNSTMVMMAAPEIWQALVRSGKMPRQLSFEDMMNGLMKAALGTD